MYVLRSFSTEVLSVECMWSDLQIDEPVALYLVVSADLRRGSFCNVGRCWRLGVQTQQLAALAEQVCM